jgi:CMP-N,N'-diacetyllegionaminic acid synthase
VRSADPGREYDLRVPTAVALVPARAGSERVPGKNVHPLAGHPLIAYTIAAALESGVFETVLVSTDSAEITRIAEHYGADVPGLRPAELATATSPDIEWVLHVMRDRDEESFSILRPTSPFRTAVTIRRAWEELLGLGARADSIRAVERARQHPGKMWTIEGELMRPLLPQSDDGTPTYSSQTKALPPVFVQNSSLEIAWRRVLEGGRPEIGGNRIAPFFTEGWEGFSIDYPEDLEQAAGAVARGEAALPRIAMPAPSSR